MKYILLILGILTINISVAQNLYPEKYDACKLSRFCLDCGDTKAQAPKDFVNDFVSSLDEKSLNKINGVIEVQILIDSLGNQCLLSAKNDSNIKSDKLNLQKRINQTGKWLPARSGEKAEQVSVSLLLTFSNGNLSIQRKEFDFKNNTNFKSVGSPEVKGSKDSKLSESWTLFNQQNSSLPWDMSRAAAVDNHGLLWFGTDNGLVNMLNGEMEVFNTKNSSLKHEKFNENKTVSIRDISVDQQNNKWIIASWDVYKFDGKNWTVYDSLNSPISWARKIFVDKSNNVWFTSWEGVSKFDGNEWSVIDTTNSKLPSNRVLGIFVDSKESVWIGTFEGNIRIENAETVEFNSSDSPLKDAAISKMFEDTKGNLWFDLYNDDDRAKAGMFVLRKNGHWESIKPKNSDLFNNNSINDFLLDEENNILWIALNNVGLIKYDIASDKWETYTNGNSNVPSSYVMQFAKDKEGTIWAATFAGIVKLNKK